MRIIVAGIGAFGMKHLDGIRNIDGIEVAGLVGRREDATKEKAEKYGVENVFTDLEEALELPDVEAAILATPTQMHAAQAIQCMRAGKHVEVEIPVADTWADALEVDKVQKETGRICMVGHTRRFNPSHQWVIRKIRAGELTIQQMDVQTYFFRRKNINAEGEPRSWTDHMLWHHAAHTIDLIQYQTGEKVVKANGIEGPHHPGLGIAMDMSIQLLTDKGTICTLSLSFNNDGPLGTF
ncbi:MAG: Gfo/Idh/MocA family oxidoreductase, partial [Woeseiaceae bacterium]|nr:Gfo/Idh/MocA family oxidoreductase [Woeseiaceae bacterium]